MTKPANKSKSVQNLRRSRVLRKFAPKVESLPLSELKPNVRNPRTHTDKQISQIALSIATFGFLVPILVDDDNVVLAGNARLEAAKSLGLKIVPVIRISHLTQAEKRAYIIADNKMASLAGWDQEILAVEMKYLVEIDTDFDIGITGFETAEIDLLIEFLDARKETVDADALPAIDPDRPPVSRRGDRWKLGPHRLMCGDATNAEDCQRLMGAKRAHVGFNDCPYNVKINGHVSGLGRIKHREFIKASGEMTAEEYLKFLNGFLAVQKAFSHPGAVNFVCIDWRHVDQLFAAGRLSFGEVINLCCWVKENGGMGSTYRSQHELVVVLKKTGAPHKNNIQLGRHGRYRTNVWNYAGVNSFKKNRLDELSMHPTVKPVPLVMDAIKDVSDRGDIVLDCFMGSGTTLIAAHKTGRCAYGMELDPIYVDTAIRRWQSYTGERAVHAETGLSFDEVQGQRHG